MAEDPKIILDPPPAAPFDVPITPDPAPARPFDVPTYPDPPPGSPFDVGVTPDPAPLSPHDVPVSPDAPPWKPVDVPVTLDSPPRLPFDVPTTPDGPPVVPHDVALAPDAPPAVPFDVTVTPDGPPVIPFDVAVNLDAGPAVPFNVAVTLDPPPTQPDPNADLGIHLSPDPIDVGGSRGLNLSGIAAIVGRVDHYLGSFLNGLVDLDVSADMSVSFAGGGAFDPRILANWYKNYVSAVGGGGLVKFIAEQQTLYAMNPLVAKVFNPSYFIEMMVPGSMGHIHTTVDTQGGITAKTVIEGVEVVKHGLISGEPRWPVDRQDVYDQSHTFTDGQEMSVDATVDAILDGVGGPGLRFMTKDAQGTMRFDASKYFDIGEGHSSVKLTTAAAARDGSINVMASPLRRSNFLDGVIPAAVRGEDPDGSIYSDGQDPSDKVDDDDVRIPLSFTDLRRDPIKGYRSVYFRPMNLTFGKTISPEYAETTAFGRTDPNMSYVKTGKGISVGFELHAFAPEDLKVMYNKMLIMESMCYPSYGEDSLMKSGPVVRLRIGDAVGTELGGVPGVIKSLNFDFEGALWELHKGMKVPRSFKVSIDFTALHDGPVGLLNGTFGVLKLPAGVKADKDTNFAGSTDSQETPEIASVSQGLYSRFGQPRRS